MFQLNFTLVFQRNSPNKNVFRFNSVLSNSDLHFFLIRKIVQVDPNQHFAALYLSGCMSGRICLVDGLEGRGGGRGGAGRLRRGLRGGAHHWRNRLKQLGFREWVSLLFHGRSARTHLHICLLRHQACVRISWTKRESVPYDSIIQKNRL